MTKAEMFARFVHGTFAMDNSNLVRIKPGTLCVLEGGGSFVIEVNPSSGKPKWTRLRISVEVLDQ